MRPNPGLRGVDTGHGKPAFGPHDRHRPRCCGHCWGRPWIRATSAFSSCALDVAHEFSPDDYSSPGKDNSGPNNNSSRPNNDNSEASY